jgi:hypothetical protein
MVHIALSKFVSSLAVTNDRVTAGGPGACNVLGECEIQRISYLPEWEPEAANIHLQYRAL